MITSLKKICVFLSIIALICIVGQMDADDEYRTFKQYCVDVSNGVHPDYKGEFAHCD